MPNPIGKTSYNLAVSETAMAWAELVKAQLLKDPIKELEYLKSRSIIQPLLRMRMEKSVYATRKRIATFEGLYQEFITRPNLYQPALEQLKETLTKAEELCVEIESIINGNHNEPKS